MYDMTDGSFSPTESLSFSTTPEKGQPPLVARNDMSEDQVLNIGRMAGRIWHELDINGSMSVSALVRRIASPRDYVMEGIGWLAREGKISIHEEGRVRLVRLLKN